MVIITVYVCVGTQCVVSTSLHKLLCPVASDLNSSMFNKQAHASLEETNGLMHGQMNTDTNLSSGLLVSYLGTQ